MRRKPKEDWELFEDALRSPPPDPSLELLSEAPRDLFELLKVPTGRLHKLAEILGVTTRPTGRESNVQKAAMDRKRAEWLTKPHGDRAKQVLEALHVYDKKTPPLLFR